MEKLVYLAVKLKNFETAAKFQSELTEINEKIYPTLVTTVAVQQYTLGKLLAQFNPESAAKELAKALDMLKVLYGSTFEGKPICA